uniref:Na+/H+ antiporter subunit C n=1 Tax=Ignisphaera aggregans TaxID=334771 RepID=A0A7C5XKJ1_9CREN
MSEEYIISLAFRTAMISFIFNIAVALYGIFSRPSLIKKLLCLIIFADSINIFAIFIGFRYIPSLYPSPPILSDIPTTVKDIQNFVTVSVDPLPQALVLTAIVIGLASSMFLISLILMYYRHYGTTDIHVSEEAEKYEEDIE